MLSPELDDEPDADPAAPEPAAPEAAPPLAAELLPDWFAGLALDSLLKQSFGIASFDVYLLWSQRGSTCGVLALGLVGCEGTAAVSTGFLSLARSPKARADVLANATRVLRIRAGADLRIWCLLVVR